MTDEKPTLLQVLKSVLASFFGVQSNNNRERDFQHGNPSHYLIVGLILTVAFIVAIWLALSLARV